MATKIIGVFGTRAQALKLDPKLCDILVNTGQHIDNDLFGQHLKTRKIVPKYNLNLTSDETGVMMDKIRVILRKERPDIVVVYGDTNSTAAGAWASALENIPIAHVEAGLRSYDMSMPEEVNRVIADRLATFKFVPSLRAYDNLLKENIGDNTHIVGDALFDALQGYTPIKRTRDWRKYVFASLHRQENLTQDRLTSIMEGLEKSGQPIIMTLHPRTKRLLNEFKIKIPKNIRTLKPLSRKDTLSFTSNARMVFTDSGGLQREAYWFMVPSVIPRNLTEWQEIVDEGWAVCVGANAELIASSLQEWKPTQPPMSIPRFGANQKIRTILQNA